MRRRHRAPGAGGDQRRARVDAQAKGTCAQREPFADGVRGWHLVDQPVGPGPDVVQFGPQRRGGRDGGGLVTAHPVLGEQPQRRPGHPEHRRRCVHGHQRVAGCPGGRGLDEEDVVSGHRVGGQFEGHRAGRRERRGVQQRSGVQVLPSRASTTAQTMRSSAVSAATRATSLSSPPRVPGSPAVEPPALAVGRGGEHAGRAAPQVGERDARDARPADRSASSSGGGRRGQHAHGAGGAAPARTRSRDRRPRGAPGRGAPPPRDRDAPGRACRCRRGQAEHAGGSEGLEMRARHLRRVDLGGARARAASSATARTRATRGWSSTRSPGSGGCGTPRSCPLRRVRARAVGGGATIRASTRRRRPPRVTRSWPRMAKNRRRRRRTSPSASSTSTSSSEMQGSFLEYAYSVIYSRALPDARDGLKPVQRRILFQMAEMGLRPDRGHVKSRARRRRRHGQAAPARRRARSTTPWSGWRSRSRCGCRWSTGTATSARWTTARPPPRYTEARLAPAALLMTDGPRRGRRRLRPELRQHAHAARGAARRRSRTCWSTARAGIAVGMATNMAPHNLVEVIGAARHLLANPDATLDDLMRFVPGPDLPTGGKIIGLEGIREAYATGRGTFRTRATARIENVTRPAQGHRRHRTAVPRRARRRSSRRSRTWSRPRSCRASPTSPTSPTGSNGLRLVIEVKNGFNPEAVLEQLYRLTPMEDSFGINNVCLVDGQPRTLGLQGAAAGLRRPPPRRRPAPVALPPARRPPTGCTSSRACSSRSSTSTR